MFSTHKSRKHENYLDNFIRNGQKELTCKIAKDQNKKFTFWLSLKLLTLISFFEASSNILQCIFGLVLSVSWIMTMLLAFDLGGRGRRPPNSACIASSVFAQKDCANICTMMHCDRICQINDGNLCKIHFTMSMKSTKFFSCKITPIFLGPRYYLTKWFKRRMCCTYLEKHNVMVFSTFCVSGSFVI